MVALRMLEPGGARLHPVPVSRIGTRGVFVFPIGFQSYSEDRPGRVQTLEVVDGVLVETLGLSTPRWKLEGTFGNKPKTIDGRIISAHEAQEDLHRFVGYYFTERLRRIRSRQPLIEMAFDDFYNNRHWIVTPDSAPSRKLNAREPVRPRFSFGLTGIRPATQPNFTPDTLRERLGITPGAPSPNLTKTFPAITPPDLKQSGPLLGQMQQELELGIPSQQVMASLRKALPSDEGQTAAVAGAAALEGMSKDLEALTPRSWVLWLIALLQRIAYAIRAQTVPGPDGLEVVGLVDLVRLVEHFGVDVPLPSGPVDLEEEIGQALDEAMAIDPSSKLVLVLGILQQLSTDLTPPELWYSAGGAVVGYLASQSPEAHKAALVYQFVREATR